MKSFKRNPKKLEFLDSRPKSCIDTSDIAARSKFNFSFFDCRQDAGQSFEDWNLQNGACSLDVLLNKMKEYTKEPLSYWRNQRCGGGGLKILGQYGDFPSNSEFNHPDHVPHDACWARFRLGNKVRLIGFLIPEELNGKEYTHRGHSYKFDSNTFYLVFLDQNHVFYKTERD